VRADRPQGETGIRVVEHLGGGAGFFNVIRIYATGVSAYRHGERDEVGHQCRGRARIGCHLS
jgi:hypothetical protein